MKTDARFSAEIKTFEIPQGIQIGKSYEQIFNGKEYVKTIECAYIRCSEASTQAEAINKVIATVQALEKALANGNEV